MSELLQELGIEPEPMQGGLEIEPEPPADLEIEPEPPPPVMAGVVEAALVPMALMEILPADFPLPALTKFVPDAALRVAVNKAAAYALAVDVTGADGLQRADVALGVLQASQKAIVEHFEEPAALANALHKRLTGIRGEWLEAGEQAKKTVGNRMWAEKRRLDDIAAEERRKQQAEADRIERDRLAREAAAAEQAQAPAAVVDELRERAQTATAPPVPVSSPAPALAHTAATTTWKVRPKGTPASAEPNPEIAKMTPPQLAQVRVLLQAILDDKAPMTAIEINYSKLNAQAKADKKTFQMPGFEAFEAGGTRAKGARGR